MPEITKSGAKLRLFIVTHKYTDLYFIFFFQTPTPGRQANLGLRLPNRPSAVAFPIGHHSSDCASPSKKTPSSSHCANGAIHRHRRKTAEERFNTLARGWLAYPVTPTHAHLPPKSGCRNAIPACARGALLLVTPSARRDSGGRMGHRRDTISMRFGDALLPPSRRNASPLRKNRHHHRIAPTTQYIAIGENRRRAVSHVSTGLARLPRDANASPIYRRRAVV